MGKIFTRTSAQIDVSTLEPSLRESSRRQWLLASASLCAFAAAGASVTLSAQASAISVGAADTLNNATALRMLSQRIAKGYAQLALGVLPPQSAEILAASSKRFSGNIALLRGANLPPESAKALAEVERAAVAMLAAANAAVTRDALPSVLKSSDETLAAAEALVKSLPSSGAPGASLIALAGRQRMLSQRASKFYFFYQTGMKTPEVRGSYERALKDFETVMREFAAQSQEFPEINDEVELAAVQIDFFKTAARVIDNPSDAQKATVARTSERLLETMDSLTREMVAKFSLREVAGAPPAASKKR